MSFAVLAKFINDSLPFFKHIRQNHIFFTPSSFGSSIILTCVKGDTSFILSNIGPILLIPVSSESRQKIFFFAILEVFLLDIHVLRHHLMQHNSLYKSECALKQSNIPSTT
jgi:hypothetical protein